MATNGVTRSHISSKAEEVESLLNAVKPLLIDFIKRGDEEVLSSHKVNGHIETLHGNHDITSTSLVHSLDPEALQRELIGKSGTEISEDQLATLDLPDEVAEKDRTRALLDFVDRTLKYSVNTWHQGFMDKLYGGTNAVGVVSELLLAVLNTNVHVYQVSPVIALAEKATGKRLAQLFGLNGPYAGGVTCPGGSASNFTSLIIARNTLFPETKLAGYQGREFAIFVSVEGHYSLTKAAMMAGFGQDACMIVAADEHGRMIPVELERQVQRVRESGKIPFYVCATAGTTVLGAFDPIDAIADVCQREKLWLHVDGSYGGSFIFSDTLKSGRLDGVDRADSITINPHKMLGVPVTCSFLLSKDLREFHAATTLPANYLFHNDFSDEVFDLADLTLQCGRKGEGLKMFLGWTYYGRAGYTTMIENAYDVANHFLEILTSHPHMQLVSKRPLPCLQVCFYWWPREEDNSEKTRGRNDSATPAIVRALLGRGFMIDFATGPHGKMFRVVVNIHTTRETLDKLLKAIEDVGSELKLSYIP